MKNTLFYNITIALSGLFAGGCITILFILVPFWKSLPPTELMVWFSHNGPYVGITMLPMQILPLLFTTYAYILARKNKEKSKEIWLYANISNGIILLMFVGYYLSVNLQFINQTMNPDDVAFELQRWEMIHFARTILAILSTVLAIVAYFRYEEDRNTKITTTL